MGNKKLYADPSFYENKLKKVMARLGIENNKFDWNFDRHGGWVSFYYKGQFYRFEHSVESAKTHGQKLAYGSDAFAQIVLALEDLARLVERGIYDLSTWVAGMKALPPTAFIPDFFQLLGFQKVPTQEEVKRAYKEKASVCHPDKGGSAEDFQILHDAYEKSLEYLQSN